eukprot:1367359-Rhodomonas_salina.2
MWRVLTEHAVAGPDDAGAQGQQLLLPERRRQLAGLLAGGNEQRQPVPLGLDSARLCALSCMPSLHVS